jgi:O-acetylhomoserine/O-acetylserine sulfhydrylase
VDADTRAEFEERQKNNPMNGIMGAATGQQGGNPMQNFDMAGFLAGASSKKESTSGSNTPPVSYSDAVKGGGGGGKKGMR